GALAPLVQLFANLEGAALAGELEPLPAAEAATSHQVAHALAAQIAARRTKEHGPQRAALDARGAAIVADLHRWFTDKRAELVGVFAQQGIDDVQINIISTASEDVYLRHIIYRHLDFR